MILHHSLHLFWQIDFWVDNFLEAKSQYILKLKITNPQPPNSDPSYFWGSWIEPLELAFNEDIYIYISWFHIKFSNYVIIKGGLNLKQSLIRNGQMVLKKAMHSLCEIEILSTTTMLQTLNNKQFYIRKAHISLRLRWANNLFLLNFFLQNYFKNQRTNF